MLREPTAPDCLSGPGPFVSHHAFRDTDNTEVMWLYLQSRVLSKFAVPGMNLPKTVLREVQQ